MSVRDEECFSLRQILSVAAHLRVVRVSPPFLFLARRIHGYQEIVLSVNECDVRLLLSTSVLLSLGIGV